MAYRPNLKNADGTLADLPIAAETAEIATKLKTPRTIGLSGITATAQNFDGSSNISILVTNVPTTLLTGIASIDTTGNAKTATTAKDYNTSGTIKSKFDSIDTGLTNLGNIKIGSTLYQVRTTTTASDSGQSGFITFIL